MVDQKNFTCTACNGTGRDERKTQQKAREDAEFKHRMKHHGTYIRCWTCNGNGLDPAAFFNWSKSHGRQ